MKKLLLPILLAMSLTACISTGNRDPDVNVVVQPTAPIVPPLVDPVTTQPVNWQVLNSQGVRDLAARIEQTGENVVLYTLDSEGFRALSNNLVDIRRYVREKNAAFDFVMEAAKPKETPPQ